MQSTWRHPKATPQGRRPKVHHSGAGKDSRVLVAVGNTLAYGGGYRICPAADPTDGLLDVVIGGEFSRAGLLRILPRVRRGTHVGHRLVSCHQAGTVTLDAEGIVAYADGERLGPLPLTATAVPGALTLLGP